jgi:acetyl esterase/lipase
MYGNRGDAAGAFLTSYGMAAASIDYRLAPRNRFPAQAKDCRDALIFLHENARKYALDPDRIGVMGESAGGHLAALTATAPDTPEFIGSYHDKSAPRVKAFCSVSGPMDIAYLGALADMVEDLVGKHDVYQLIGGRVQDKLELANLASPVQHVSSDDPPALLIYGEKDFLVLPIVAQKMHERLQAAGVASE